MHLVVALDGSEVGEQAVRAAVEVAADLEASITAVYVLPEQRDPIPAGPTSHRSGGDEPPAIARGAHVLERAAAIADRRGLDVSTRMFESSVVPTVVELVESSGADWLFVGYDDEETPDAERVIQTLVESCPVAVTAIR